MEGNTSSKRSFGRIFILDDESSVLRSYGRKFETAGFTVVASDRANKALQDIIAFKPDLVFLDMVMPGADGIHILRKLKRTTKTKWIPVVMLTNMDHESDRELAKDSGASDYIVKIKVTPGELVTYAKKVLVMNKNPHGREG